MNFKYLKENIDSLNKFDCLNDLYNKIFEEIINCFNSGKKLVFIGNGGSATDSAHIATDFFLQRNGKFLPAIALSDNTALVLSIANDYSYDDIFLKQIDAYCEEGDIIFGITTSGNSKNVLNALDYAKNKYIKTVLVTGENFNYKSDYVVNMPSTKTTIIQNMYMIFFHMLCLEVDNYYDEHRN